MAFFSRPPSWESRGRGDSQGAHLRPSLWGGLLNGSLNGETNPDSFVGAQIQDAAKGRPSSPLTASGGRLCVTPQVSR